MPLQPGRRLGPYEVVAAIGAGGMGEVYRAHDTKLHRDVALKILPDAFAADPDRLARFEREAQVLASLNHPNIAGIYGLEDADGVKALALELVEGPTLADRIAQGPIPVDDALPIARQIAEALEAAHDAGIIHRDLKPANIKLRPDGTVKVLDFGLAKLGAPDSSRASSSASYSPTLTTPAMTGMGVILGTAAYMAPEQARGKPVDKRADIWAFGCVLYEMLTGARAFDGDDVTVVMASIIKSEPEWHGLPPDTPRAVRMVLQRCLQKDPKQRLRDIGDARLALEGAFDAAPAAAATPAMQPRPSAWRRAAPWAGGFAAGALLVAIAGAVTLTYRVDAEPVAPTRFAVTLPEGDRLPGATGTLLAISPDGRTVLYRTMKSGENTFSLYRRTMDQLEATRIGDGNVGEALSFSPEGRWIAFTVGTTLKKIPAAGGTAQTLAELPSTARGASWGADDTIVLGGQGAGLIRVPAAGGAVATLTTPDSGRLHWYPQVLPGGRAVLYTSSEQRPDGGELEIVDLDTGERRVLLPGSGGRVLPSGHLVFLRGGSLWAVAFDSSRLETIGTPVPVVEGVRVEPGGAVQFAVAGDGTLTYLQGGIGTARRLAWVDRQGREELIAAPPRFYVYPRLSPDASRVASDVRDLENDIWIWEFARQTLSRLTSDPAPDQYPAWTRDGRRILFFSGRQGSLAAFSQAADGSGSAQRLGGAVSNIDQASVSPDGTRLLVRTRGPSSEDIATLSLDGTGRLEPLLQSKFTERNAEISPEGRWLAYQSDESGSMEVYVRPFPLVDSGRWQISAGGGGKPVWTRNGRELLYLTAMATLMSVPIHPGPDFKFGNSTAIVDLSQYSLSGAGRDFDISPDGQRVLVLKDAVPQGADAQIHVVQHWLEDLKRLVPVN